MTLAADSWCKTSATDAKSFYYNPEFIDSLNNHQIKFVLIHEALHCALTPVLEQYLRQRL
jgi:predicted metal-dependent peptidase